MSVLRSIVEPQVPRLITGWSLIMSMFGVAFAELTGDDAVYLSIGICLLLDAALLRVHGGLRRGGAVDS